MRNGLSDLPAGMFVMWPTKDTPIDLVAPDPAMIKIEHIALALSRINCYSGHTSPGPYSVAEHSIRVSELLPKEQQLKGLLHDAHEYVTSDIPRPLKLLLMQGSDLILQIQLQLDQAIGQALGEDLLQAEELARADDLAAEAEQYALRGIGSTPHEMNLMRNESVVYERFMARYYELKGA